MTNCQNSVTHRLPPETLAVVASHLDNDSLTIATHVCHFWRSTFLTFPHLWSHLDFCNEQRALAFLDRSKSVPVSVSLMMPKPSETIKESLKGIVDRLTELRASQTQFFDAFLAQSFPVLTNLHAYNIAFGPHTEPVLFLPSIKSLTTTSLDPNMFRVPQLTSFRFELNYYSNLEERAEDILFNFLQRCPLLEVIFLSYHVKSNADTGTTTEKAAVGVVSLPLLRSFTHESPHTGTTCTNLFQRLSLPSTCDLAFGINTSSSWVYSFGALFDLPYFTNVKMVKVTAKGPIMRSDTNFALREEFLNFNNQRISLYQLSRFGPSCFPSDTLNFLESSGNTHSVGTLHFERYSLSQPPGAYAVYSIGRQLQKFDNLKTLVLWKCDPTPFLERPSPPEVWCPSVEKLVIHTVLPEKGWEPKQSRILEWVRNIAISRREHGIPLKIVNLVLEKAEWLLKTRRTTIEELRSCVGSLEVVEA